MAYIPKEVVAKAKEMDLLTYLKNYEPGELKHVKGNVYQTVTHDSLKISNGKWMWWSEGIGGRSALDYLIKVRGIQFTEAVEMIAGNIDVKAPVAAEPVKEVRHLVAPDEADDNKRALGYLTKRGIDREILEELYAAGIWYQTKEHNNVAFVGADYAGMIKLVTLRGTYGNFKNTVAGSDRKYPVRVSPELLGNFEVKNNVVHLFEAPVDMLSYMTLMKMTGTDYRNHNFIALCGIYQPKEKIEESAVPSGLIRYIEEKPHTKTVCLHLDNDEPGKKAAQALGVVLKNRGLNVINQPPPEGFKDCNEFLNKGSRLLTAVRNREIERG